MQSLLAVSLATLMSAATADTVSVTPHLFAPGRLSGPAREDCLSFTPGGDTAYYGIEKWPNSMIVESHRGKDGWSAPKLAPFAGKWLDHDPAVSPDGSFIVFASNRPAKDGGELVKSAGNLWRVDRKGGAWGEPWRLPDAVNTSPRSYAPSIAADGSVYFIQPGPDKLMHIFRSQYRDGAYQAPVRQMLGKPAERQKDPGIAPDESFVVFDAPDPASPDRDRFFIAFREGDHWGPAADMGDAVNADNNPWGPHVSADGKTLYYTSDRSVPVDFPRSPEQAQQDFQRLQSWDDGENNIWSLDLTPYIEAHKAHRI